ncbi:hypothetical protein [Paenibacillus chitinolyticus]|nr:hypothetical protein [Paenibacillus chitinolyticus]
MMTDTKKATDVAIENGVASSLAADKLFTTPVVFAFDLAFKELDLVF